MVKIKTLYNEDVRLLPEQAASSYDELVQRVSQAYNLIIGTFLLFWTDEDGDNITVGSDADWTQALLLNKTSIRIHVRQTNQSQPNQSQSKEQKPRTEPSTQQSNNTSEGAQNPRRNRCHVFRNVLEELKQQANVADDKNARESSDPTPEEIDLHVFLTNFHNIFSPFPFVQIFEPQFPTERQQRCRRRCSGPRRCPCPRRQPQKQQGEPQAKPESTPEPAPPVPEVIQPGDLLPSAPIFPGNFGPGVEQLQHALIHLGLMPADAIRWRSGLYARNTARAIASLFNEKEDDESNIGVFTEEIRNRLLNMLGVVSEKQDNREPQEKQEPQLSESDTTGSVQSEKQDDKSEENTNANVADSQEESENKVEEQAQKKVEETVETEYKEQLKILKTMGFHQTEAEIARSLNNHHGAVPFVVSELLGL
eukprot:m.332258 g.332258  ORF g.332258 m.332258 type:complete len:423 (+) comp16910_c0_seq1:186-1454(+)